MMQSGNDHIVSNFTLVGNEGRRDGAIKFLEPPKLARKNYFKR